MKAFALVLIFVASLAGSAALLSRVLPPALIPQFSEKLAHFAAHKDEYDTLFIGSSRTYRQVLPTIFDPLMAAGGTPTKTFNFGLDAMFAPEDCYVLEQIYALGPTRLRRVVMEISHWNSDFTAQGRETLRAKYWHDWRRTWLLWTDRFPARRKDRWTEPRRREIALAHLNLFVRRALNLGEGVSLIERWRPVPTEPVAPVSPEFSVLGTHRDGAAPYAAQVFPAAGEQQLFAEQMAERSTKKKEFRKMSPSPLANLRRMIALVREMGAQPILFTTPISMRQNSRPASETDAPVIDFNDPERWPDLFREEYRWDRAHLNLTGAEIFSRLMAEQIMALPPAAP